MKHFDEIYEIAADNYGLITTSQAKKFGVTRQELNRWVATRKLIRLGYGLYKLQHYIPTDKDIYAEAVARVGNDAHLMEESVLDFHNLALVNPNKVYVGTSKRIRRTLPPWLVVKFDNSESVVTYEGVPSQSIFEAIISCKTKVMPERLLQALDEAYEQGLINQAERIKVKGELYDYTNQQEKS